MPVPFLRSLTCAAALAAVTPLPTLVQADGLAGAYLAARAATLDSDYQASADYYNRALVRDPQNPLLMEHVVFSRLALGDVKGAASVASRLREMGARSQVANIVMAADAVQKETYQAIIDREGPQHEINALVDGLMLGWAHLGAGSVSDALAQFDEMAKKEGLGLFARYHRALALASVGDYEGAETLFAAEDGQLTNTSRRAVIARLEILSQLGRNEQALEVLTDAFNGQLDPGLATLARRLKAGETLPYALAANPKHGIAEVFFTMGAALNGEMADDYVLMYARVAAALREDHVDALLLAAELFDQLGRYTLSIDLYKQVPRDHPDYHAAELGRAEALRRAAKPDAAAEVLQQLARDFPNEAPVYTNLGDLLRQQEDYSGAVAAYDTALGLMDDSVEGRWFLLYARGICHERLKNWEQAETDFRAALTLRPDQPQVLNYLGYSLVEKQVKLDEALSMIERAVAARPDAGYIVDSLGWVLYRLGRYQDAVGHMETAVELMPVDPVVNDHLGDVYWAVGRAREAEFQWKRALSFIDPEDTDGEADPERIRRKLELGLDAVLAEEGAAPLKVAHDG
ncbi:tetratricopeptide repeat protein [Phaeobacter porticola]|uniref:Tetratricopeptide repeat-containing protein n=1 Tax=Phaeobacter porticola TaxID=1844006 RepID=A0A1L3I8L1_9RHOB|nr:tetratricopeptide repeat protein [Phaeobacter porticola]APG48401.1 tetratricopeptide repeat-containing protein [Phaeobacter porticola]